MTKVILLVEDNPTDEKLTRRALERSGIECDVVVARDGVQALDYLHGPDIPDGQPTGKVPSVVLLDLKLPRVGGLDVIRKIRSDPRTALLPIVVLTASAEQEDIAESYSRGANAYIRKPVDFGAFLEAARTLVTFWISLNESVTQGPGR
jgi:CheY-like chemotaxis protein